jgi:DNA polymerase-3 subunit delta
MDTPPTVYFLYGDHDLIFKDFISRLKEKMGAPENAEMNIERFSPSELDLSKLEQICSTLPFLAPRRVVIAEQPSQLMSSESEKERLFEFLNSIPASTALVLIETIDFKSARGKLPSKPSQLEEFLQNHPSAYIRRCEIPRGPQFVTWIHEHTEELGGKIEGQAAHLLSEFVAEDLHLAHQEIEKLLTYVNFERPIVEADVEELTPFYGQSDVFAMVDAVGRRDGQQALKSLRQLLTDEYPLYVFSMIIRQFRLLLMAKEAQDKKKNPQTVLNLSPFVTKKIVAQAQNFNLGDLEKIYRHLLEVDVGSKTGQNTLDVALESFITQLAK